MVLTAIFQVHNPAQRLVTAQEYGDEWPFTVSMGTLACTLRQVTFEHDDTVYAVNLTAAASGEYADVEAILAEPTETRNQRGVTPLIETGRKLCGW